jgi:hypothetical protein
MRVLSVALASLGLLASAALGRSPERLDELLAQLRTDPSSAPLLHAIDQEAAQKDAARSGLFWHTDLNDAIEAAKAAGKPILSLRLLGRLDEELSCANSRFFRKTLYVDPNVIALLKRRFILHWESVRPVPLVTIDYGDGNKVTRTLTGNSIHYLLAPDGRLLDGLPGLIDAATFARELTTFADLVEGRADVPSDRLNAYYDQTLRTLSTSPAVTPAPAAPPRPADRAMRITASKAVVERRVLTGVRNPSLYVMQDTVKNQRELRPKLIAWLRGGPVDDLKAFNARVYAELFETPLNDPLMGLDLPDEAAIAAAPVVQR